MRALATFAPLAAAAAIAAQPVGAQGPSAWALGRSSLSAAPVGAAPVGAATWGAASWGARQGGVVVTIVSEQPTAAQAACLLDAADLAEREDRERAEGDRAERDRAGAAARATARAYARAAAAPAPARDALGRVLGMAPRGYLGVRLSEFSAVRWGAAGRVVRYCAYPVVVSVEPSSPADRGGVAAGDTLVAYGSHDLMRDGPVALDRLLAPGASLRVRVRRDGRTLVRTLTVGRAPEPTAVAFHFATPNGRHATAAPDGSARTGVAPGAVTTAAPWPDADVRRQYEQQRQQLLALQRQLIAPTAPRATPTPALGPTRVILGRARPGPDVPMMVLPFGFDADEPTMLDMLRALPPLPATAWAPDAPAALAGAQVVALDDDLREVLVRAVFGEAAESGPVRGVFVLKVLPGTPAAEAGLRAGDVVTAAGGRQVITPRALQGVLAGRALAERKSVTLRVWRAGTARDVALRW